ncbi:MAG TPA: efflux RND transporter periplasmic adaptor subunit [Candidatus Moranbacteria bacterium]|nr:efflux RND transporter periplasmic adaptor subunit [Candidatus Moranbacteria bacterium]HSA08377.1 efflux RND transporter periplasmic adaptor subunit [Candidatus Moranbacteria bacterium]
MAKAKKWTIWILIIAAIIGGVFWYVKSRQPKTTYTTAEIAKGNLTRTVSVTGKLVAKEQADLSFKISGRIEAMFVDIGDKVEKGQKIATIDKGTLNEQLYQAKQDLIAQRNALYSMKRNNSGYNWAQKDAQRAVIKKAESAVTAVREQISETTLYSPISGIVITKNVDEGETTVANAVTANTSVVTIAREGELEVQANIPESDIVKIALGQKANVTLDAFNAEDIFSAEIVEIEPSATVIQDVVYYKVKLKFPAYDERFKNGMSANIDIHTAEKEGVLMVPARAIKEDGKKKYVEVLKADGITTEKIYIETGLEGDEGMVEAKSGLKGGEKVVTFVATK